ncbi:MAG: PspC domain-containing protein, partial [Muribaculaceae bacterium]|nr:PspC domain-containing protein [Muribaculaceae bacterium]
MKQTLNINIAGNVFTIDNDAYMLLSDYLDTLQHAFGRNDEGQELIIDIEARIAEIFAQLIEGGQNVITLRDVEAIIARIGRPEEMLEVSEEFDLNSDEEKVTVECRPVPPPYVPPVKVQKKLYRDPQGSMLGGVCMGLSWYTGVDVTWIRLIIIALCFAPIVTVGSMFSSVFPLSIIYLILWIVVPEARSPLQRMQMMGKAPTIDNIGRTVTDSFKESEGIQTVSDTSTNVESTLKKIAEIAVRIFAILARVM